MESFLPKGNEGIKTTTTKMKELSTLFVAHVRIKIAELSNIHTKRRVPSCVETRPENSAQREAT